MPLVRITRGYGLLENFLSIQRMKRAHKLIKKNNKKDVILDIGCGSYPLFLINSNFNQKYGIDQAINNTEIKGLNLIIRRFNISIDSKLPFKKNYFDVITMLAVIEHLDNEQISWILKECYSVLKKNGVLIITTPAKWSSFLLKIMAKLHLISDEEIKEHKSTLNLKELKNMLLMANFNQRKIQKGYFEFLMNLWLCVKK